MHRSGLYLVVFVVACGGRTAEHVGSDAPKNVVADASTTDARTPPAICPSAGPLMCAGTDLVSCKTIGGQPEFEPCDAGCLSVSTPHCGTIIPTGVVSVSDLNADTQLLPIVIGAVGAVVNSDTGAITGVRAAGVGVAGGIEFSVRSGVGVFRFGSLEIDGNLTFVGSNAVAFVSTTNVKVPHSTAPGRAAARNTSSPGWTDVRSSTRALEREHSVLIVDAMAAWCGPARQLDTTARIEWWSRLSGPSFAIQIDVDVEVRS